VSLKRQKSAHFHEKMTLGEEHIMIAAEALEYSLSLELKKAQDEVSATLYTTLDKQCAAQDALCRAMLAVEKTKKERFMQQAQADVESVEQKLEFLDNHVIRSIAVYERLMVTGVTMHELVALNTP